MDGCVKQEYVKNLSNLTIFKSDAIVCKLELGDNRVGC